jgi:hypothetical protein
MVEMAQDQTFDRNAAETRFRDTFNHLNVVLGSNAFKRYSDGHFKGGFLLSPFEVISFGLGFNHPNFPTPEETAEKTRRLYSLPEYQQWSGSGVRANSRLPHLIPLGRELFRNEH